MPRPRSPEEEWLHGEESEGPHEWDDPTYSPYEGEIPPWGRWSYKGTFPMAGMVFYVNAYTLIRKVPKFKFEENLKRFGHYRDVGTYPPGLTTADADYIPFAAVPVRISSGQSGADHFIEYLEKTAKSVGLEFTKIVTEKRFPQGREVVGEERAIVDIRGKVRLRDGHWFEYSMMVPFSHPAVSYASAFVTNRLYGGAEEGGWWYDTGFPVAAIPTLGEADYQEMEEYLRQTIGYESKYGLDSVLGRDVLQIYKTDTFPEEYPGARPHYE